jgi:putative ABC transport system substrate-binding protein
VTVGFLSVNSRAAMAARTDAFQQGLRELGYVEGKNIFIEYRYADAKPDRLTALAAELVQLNVQVIVTEGTTATRFAKQATSTIPIVMAQDPDPVATGFVASLARPGGNITGLSNLRPELSAKRLELLKEAIPGLGRVAVFGTLTTPGTAQALKETQLAAEALRVHLKYLDVKGPQDIETLIQAASADRADAIVVLASPFLLSHRIKLADLAAKSRLPTIYYSTDFVEDGGLMSYGVTVTDLFRRAATYVDKILKGAKPAELPIEQPTKVTFAVNLKAAKQIGFTVPPSLLLRADRVIE